MLRGSEEVSSPSCIVAKRGPHKPHCRFGVLLGAETAPSVPGMLTSSPCMPLAEHGLRRRAEMPSSAPYLLLHTWKRWSALKSHVHSSDHSQFRGHPFRLLLLRESPQSDAQVLAFAQCLPKPQFGLLACSLHTSLLPACPQSMSRHNDGIRR